MLGEFSTTTRTTSIRCEGGNVRAPVVGTNQYQPVYTLPTTRNGGKGWGTTSCSSSNGGTQEECSLWNGDAFQATPGYRTEENRTLLELRK
ncbi:hypothetical protein DMENIID0001_101370 [Sergentomyia squamirostris]